MDLRVPENSFFFVIFLDFWDFWDFCEVLVDLTVPENCVELLFLYIFFIGRSKSCEGGRAAFSSRLRKRVYLIISKLAHFRAGRLHA